MPARTRTRSARLGFAQGASLLVFGLSVALLWPPPASATTPTPLMSCCSGSACCGPVALPCRLSYGADGTVVDARTGAPIAGARITVGGDVTTTSNADGSFGAFGNRPETCNLDYYMPVVVEARGYAPFSDALYTSVPLRHLDVRLEPLGTATGFMVSGVVTEYPPCQSGMDGVTVVLAPLGLRARTGPSSPGYLHGFFTFADVPPGTYTLSVEPRCNLYGCWDPQLVTVTDFDVGLSFCPHVEDDVARLGAGRVTGAPGSAVDVDFSLHTAGADVAHVASTIGFEPEARIAAAIGTPDCEVVADVEAAAFSWVPAGCTPGECVAVRSEVQIGGTPPPDGAALFRCRIAITDQPADSCYHVLRCVDLEVSDRNGVPLEAMCENGSVTSETPRAGLGFSFSVTPERPVVGERVEVQVSVIGTGGDPTYRLYGATPLFVGETTVTNSGPVSQTVTFELDAVRSGTVSLSVGVSYETTLGCPGLMFFGFVSDTSEPIQVEIGGTNATPTPTPTATPTKTHVDGTECSEIPGHVSFGDVHVSPAVPMVGDEVEVRFEVGFAVYSVLQLTLRGAAPLLEGETLLYGSRNATFQLTAVEPGTAFLELAVTYATEEQCVDMNGHTYIQGYGPDHTVTSDRYAVIILDSGHGCPGDCDGSGAVDISEIVEGVRIALGSGSVDTCASLDRDGDRNVTVSELITAVHAALLGCPAATPTVTPTATLNLQGTPTNPPGRCCDCPASSFVDCQALAAQGICMGWGDPCPTPSSSASSHHSDGG